MGTLAHADNLQELGQGENLAWSWASTGPVIDYAKSVDGWYKEIDEPGHGLKVCLVGFSQISSKITFSHGLHPTYKSHFF